MDFIENIDGDDYESHGKYYNYKPLLVGIRQDQGLSEQAKIRRLNFLKTQIIPLWHRREELHKRESEELMAVFLKYHGPDSLSEKYFHDYDEVKASLAATGDAVLLQDTESKYKLAPFRPGTVIDTFDYGPRSQILYKMELNPKLHPRKGDGQGEQVKEIEHARAHPEPAIGLAPVNPAAGARHHHNMNPDDDLSLKAHLQTILHRLMNHKDAWPFVKGIDESSFPDYYTLVQRPRSFTFIETQLRSEWSYGYGATAFFNDMLLVFHNCRLYNGPDSEHTTYANRLESLMKGQLREMGPTGERLLAQYNAIVEQGPESWPDHNRRLPEYDGSAPPDMDVIRAIMQEELERGQERVRQLRSRLAAAASGTGHSAEEQPVDGEAQPDDQSRKRPREQEEADFIEDELERGLKRKRSLHGASPAPSRSKRVRPRQATAKRLRASADDVSDDEDAEVIESQAPGASKQQQPTEEPVYSGAPGSSSGAGGSASYNVPSQAGRKRARTPDNDDSVGDDVEAGDGRGPEGSKRRRLMNGSPSESHPIASPEAGPATPRQATPEPGELEPGSAQSHLTSPAGPPTPQPVSFPTEYTVPSSRFLKFSRNSIPMSKIVKMGKKRPWLFSYKTAEGYGIYAFVKCPRGNCKHHFSSHPLRDYRAQDHILGCNQQIRDERDMVRQYARQVIKDDDRKSDLTIDWARKSNLHLLPAGLKDNHPENFPLSPADDDDDEEEA